MMALGAVFCRPTVPSGSLSGSGACDRYANAAGVLVRVDPVLLVRQRAEAAGGDADAADLVPFLAAGSAPVAQTPASTGMSRTTSKTSSPISTTISLALP